ncbi:MAG: ABC transporter transmembrane domain-containing protein [Chthoniobacter sp.]
MSLREFLRVSREPYMRLASYLKPYKARFLFGMLFGALFGVANGGLVFLIRKVVPLIFPDDGDHTLKFPSWMPGHPGPIIPGHATATQVIVVCATIPALMAVRGLFSYLNAYCLLWVSQRVLDDIRQNLFRHIMAQSLEFFNRAKSGELVQTVLQPDAGRAAGPHANRRGHRQAADRHHFRAHRAALHRLEIHAARLHGLSGLPPARADHWQKSAQRRRPGRG